MATYPELFEIMSNSIAGAQDLRDKIAVAAMIAADIILQGDDDTDPPWSQSAGAHDQRVKWATKAVATPIQEAENLLRLVVAANSGSAQNIILAASDAAIQNNVNAVIDGLAADL